MALGGGSRALCRRDLIEPTPAAMPEARLLHIEKLGVLIESERG